MATETVTGNRKLITRARTESRIAGTLLLLLSVLTALVFAQVEGGDAVFRLSRATDALVLPDLAVPAAPFNYAAAAILAFLGARLWLRTDGRWVSLSLGIGLTLAVAAFLVWATAGKAFSLTGMFQASIVRAVPIALGALAGVLSERVAVVNIAVEGMLLAGAFAGALVGSLAGGWIGIAAAILVGGLFGFLLAALVVTYRVDQIIAGVVINLFVLGVTSYVSSQVFQQYRFLNNAPVFRSFDIPLLADIPVIGPVLFQQNIFVYGAMVMVAVATYYLFWTRSGLRARAVGEHTSTSPLPGWSPASAAPSSRSASSVASTRT
jgi:simple sugar transport system permease protein